MHRSGTSLFANWMHDCGIFMGSNFSDDIVGNKNGHFEDMEFLLLHMDLLHKNNLDSSGLNSFHFIGPVPQESQRQIETIVNKRNQSYDSWGWKEPRTCLFLEYYRHLLPNATYIVLLRDPASVVDSLIRRDLKKLKSYFKRKSTWRYFTFDLFKSWRLYRLKKQLEETYLKAWVYYNQKLMEHINKTDKSKTLVFSFDSIQYNQKKIFSFLTNNGFTYKKIDFETIYNKELINNEDVILSYVNQNLKNEAYDLYNRLKQQTAF